MAANDISTNKQQEKWDQDTKRRENVAKAIDFYNNQQEVYTDEYLKAKYSEKAYKKLIKYMVCDPISEGIINDMSIMFQSGFSISTGVKEADEFITEVMEYTQGQALMIKLDRLVNMQKKLAVVPFYDKETDKFYFDIITGDKCYVKQRPDLPLLAEEILYSTGAMIDSPTVSDQINTYVKYTKDKKEKVEIGTYGIELKTISTEPNPYLIYNEVPFAWFYDDLNIDTFWSECGNRLVKDNLELNGLLTNHDLMLDYQTFSTLVTIGLEQGQPLYIGPQFHLNLVRKSYSSSDPTPDAKYITPDAKIKEVWDIICAKAVKCAKSVGLSAQAYTTDASASGGYNSGYQLRLSKIDIIIKNQMRQIFFIQAIKRMIRLLLMCSNIYKKTSFQVQSMKIKVNIYDPSVDLSPLEKETVRTTKIANGTWSAIRSIMEDNPDMSLEDATKEFMAIQKEKQMAVDANPLFAGMDKKKEQKDEKKETE
jgi:hypothetical protein